MSKKTSFLTHTIYYKFVGMNVLHSILTQVWFIERNYFDANALNVIRLLQGESNIFATKQETQPICTLYDVQGAEVQMGDKNNVGNTKGEYVAVFQVNGPLTKYDQECGPKGTMSLNKAINQAKNDKSVVAAVLSIDSPGGQASYIHTVAESVKKFGKPILTHVTGINASAAYYISSASSKIYAQESTDIIGSIGTMMSIMDIKPALEKQGINLHEIYADASTKKNSLIAKAFEGDYQPLKDKILNPNATAFVDYVKSNRSITDKDAYKGEIYMASEAVKIGMIDGIKSFEDVIKEAYELGIAQIEFEQKNNISNMKEQNVLDKAAQKLGFTGLESKDGYVSLTPEQLEKLMAKEEKTTPIEKTDAKELQDLQATVKGLASRLEVAEKAITVNANSIKAYGLDTTESQTAAKALEDPANKTVATSGNEKPLTEMEKYGDLMAEYGIFE